MRDSPRYVVFIIDTDSNISYRFQRSTLSAQNYCVTHTTVLWTLGTASKATVAQPWLQRFSII